MRERASAAMIEKAPKPPASAVALGTRHRMKRLSRGSVSVTVGSVGARPALTLQGIRTALFGSRKEF